MKKQYLLFDSILIIILCCLFATANAQQTESPAPKVGFAFSGGGAKGISQVGALRILENEGIRPHVITGTSIGSILGGLYAIGYSVEDLERLALELDWEYYFNDELERVFKPIEERFNSERLQLRFPFKDGEIQLPTGFVKGRKISLLFSRLTIPAHGKTDFNDFEIPYRAIATDVETGEAIVYDKGDLGDVMRASMAIPSVFEPYEIDGKLLIDGMMAQNFPVQEARDAGAETVIGFDIGGPLYKKDELSSILEILEQTSSYIVVNQHNASAAQADFLISPEIDDITSLTFDQNDTLLARGQRAAQKSLATFQHLKKDRVSLRRRGINIPDTIKVVAIEVRGGSTNEQRTINNLLQFQVLKEYTLDEIENRLKRLYGTDMVKLASYRLIPEQMGHRLIVRVIMQSGESIGISANYDSNLKAGFLLNATFRNRIFDGSRFTMDLKVSENPSAFFDYLVYTSRRPNIGFQLNGGLHFYPGITYDEGRKDDQFTLRHYNLKGAIFSSLNNEYLVKTGIGTEWYVLSEEFFDPEEDNLRLFQPYLYANFLRDTYDRVHFPKDGSKFSVEAKFGFARNLRLVESDSTSQIERTNFSLRMLANKIIRAGEQSAFRLSADAGFISGTENNFLNRFYIGREIPHERTHVEFTGLPYMAVPVTAYALGGIKYRFEWMPDLFASAIVNYGYYQLRDFSVINSIPTQNVQKENASIFGAGIELGWMTLVGPAIFSAEYNILDQRMNYVLHLGYVF